MKILMSFLVLGLSLSAFAATDICSVTYNQKDSALNWTAFKTPKKVGVKAQFTKFSIKTEKATTADELLKGATFEIETDSVSTNDKGRDAKIFNFFFKTMKSGSKITGKVTSVNKDKVKADFTFNGVTKNITLLKKVDADKNMINLSGSVNVLDFGMESNLAALTKACYALHEGVTWPDVTIELNASMTKTCK